MLNENKNETTSDNNPTPADQVSPETLVYAGVEWTPRLFKSEPLKTEQPVVPTTKPPL